MESSTTPQPATAPTLPQGAGNTAAGPTTVPATNPLTVMDIQPPPRQQFTPRTIPGVTDGPQRPVAPPSPVTPTPPATTSIPVFSSEPSTPAAAPVEEKKLEDLMGPTPDAAPPQSGVQSPPPSDVTQAPMGGQKGGKKSSKRVIILGLVLILVLLAAGGAAYAYIKMTDNKNKTAATVTPVVETKPKATTADVDSTSKALDSSLASVDDSKDYTANDLSDTTLGL